MARIVVVVLLILAASGGPGPARAQGGETVAVAGVYACEGQNPDGTPYKGIVEIVKFHTSFLVRWTLPDDVSVIGVGIFSHGVLAVSYYGGAPGVIVYRIDGNRLFGEWTMGGTNGGVFAETLTRIPVEQRQQQPGSGKDNEPDTRQDPVVHPSGGTKI